MKKILLALPILTLFATPATAQDHPYPIDESNHDEARYQMCLKESQQFYYNCLLFGGGSEDGCQRRARFNFYNCYIV